METGILVCTSRTHPLLDHWTLEMHRCQAVGRAIGVAEAHGLADHKAQGFRRLRSLQGKYCNLEWAVILAVSASLQIYS